MQGVVAGTSPLMYANLYTRGNYHDAPICISFVAAMGKLKLKIGWGGEGKIKAYVLLTTCLSKNYEMSFVVLVRPLYAGYISVFIQTPSTAIDPSLI